RALCLTANPCEQPLVMHLATGAEPARQDEDVTTRCLLDRGARLHGETIPRADRRRGEADGFHSEWRRAGAKAGDTEHLERAGEVQNFDVVEDENLYMTRGGRCHGRFGWG